MSFSVGIVGLPNVGKSTLFKALTKKQVGIAPYPFTTINPNVGIVAVPDERLKKIAEIIKPEKITPTIIEFIDIAGLVKGAYKGEGLGNQFLAHIRECDAILEIVRGFGDEKVEHTEKTINPERDVQIIKNELIMKDLETIEKQMEKLGKEIKTEKKEGLEKQGLFNKIKTALKNNTDVRELKLDEEEKSIINELQLLTVKPLIRVFNISEKETEQERNSSIKEENNPQKLVLDLRQEEEISDFSEDELKELGLSARVDRIIAACYNGLNLITFYTVKGGEETRAWTIPRGAKAIQAGGKVHSDFEEKFIKAEVIPWYNLFKAGSWVKVRESGLIKTVGRDYIVQDGDVIEFKI